MRSSPRSHRPSLQLRVRGPSFRAEANGRKPWRRGPSQRASKPDVEAERRVRRQAEFQRDGFGPGSGRSPRDAQDPVLNLRVACLDAVGYRARDRLIQPGKPSLELLAQMPQRDVRRKFGLQRFG